MKIQLSDHFTYRKLIRFTLPSIIMLIVISTYSIVDGLFVSNLVGDIALSAVNIIMPILMIIGAFGFMLGSGGSAVVSRTLGEGKAELANKYFSMIIYTVAAFGVILSIVCIIFIEPLSRLAGASDLLIKDSVVYGRILLAGSTAFMLQNTFQYFFIVAEKPYMGLIISLASGVTNMVLDYIFIKVFSMGISGAGLATVASYIVGGAIPFFYFTNKKRTGLKLVNTKFYLKIFINACSNGSSEMLSNISSSFISMLYNIQLIKIIGESGVAAYSVMMYVDFIFIGTLLGFSTGEAPIISYHYGAGNDKELKNIFKKSIIINVFMSIIMFFAAELLNYPLSAIFVGYSKELMEITVNGFELFALNYIFCGINIFSSAFFTALCNGKISAFLSFMRSFILRGGMVLLLPLIIEVNGIWLAVTVAESISAVISIIFFVLEREQYNYA